MSDGRHASAALTASLPLPQTRGLALQELQSMKSSQREYLTEVLLGQFLRERVDATFV